MNLEGNKCLHCEQTLNGRSDKRFCDAQCRATYHNKIKRKSEEVIRATNQIMRRNRTILKSLCPTGKATVRKEVLIHMGFDFGLFTSLYPKAGKVYYLSYDYGFMPLIDKKSNDNKIEKVLIIQSQTYMIGQFNPWNFVK